MTLVEWIDADVRDGARLRESVATCRPEIVFHLAAQPLVRASYELPVETFETNVIGTVNLLDALRSQDVRAGRRRRDDGQVLREPRVAVALP